jgi:hypothetical protein
MLAQLLLVAFQEVDPLMRNLEGPPLAHPVAILGLALGCLYASFMCFAQSVRLYVHVVSEQQLWQSASIKWAGSPGLALCTALNYNLVFCYQSST